MESGRKGMASGEHRHVGFLEKSLLRGDHPNTALAELREQDGQTLS